MNQHTIYYGFIVVIIGLCFVPRPGNSLRCWDCTTVGIMGIGLGNEKCADTFVEDKSLSKKDCGENDICQKTVLKKEASTVYTRQCVLKVQNKDGCRTDTTGGVTNTFCFCSSDLCNGGKKINTMSVLGLCIIGLGGMMIMKYTHNNM